jgi:hypothetical protein
MLKCALLLIAGSLMWAGADSQPSMHYVDSSQIDLAWPYYSFIRQPWRSYLEVVPARTYLDGLGVVWSGAPGGRSPDQIAADLAWAGFRRVRLEIPWNAVRWDEGGLTPDAAARLVTLLEAFKAHGLRPMILLNANHGAPGPLELSHWRLQHASQRGTHEIALQGPLVGIVPGYSEVMTFGDSGHAGPLVTEVSASGEVVLSKAASRELPAGSDVQIARLKYLPLHEVGSREFEQTAAGWLRYVDLVARLVQLHYGPDFDVEIWNEMTFGSDFLSIDNYFDHPLKTGGPDFLHSGGAAWELARRTVDELGHVAPRVKSIWGFSNTSFFHTPIEDLPAGVQGQSYHPYGVGRRCYAEIAAGREQYNVGGFIPVGCAVMPEGWAQTFQQTESLIRLLVPPARTAHPPGTTEFQHFITEHGFEPRALDIAQTDAALAAKEKFLLRAPVFWLNKGLQALFVYCSWSSDQLSFGMLRADGTATPAMAALHRMVARFGSADCPTCRRQTVGASLERVAGTTGVYPNDPGAGRVRQEQVAVVLPFEVNPRRFIVVLYLMTEDFPRDLSDQLYRVALSGLITGPLHVRYYDPESDRWLAVRLLGSASDRLAVELSLTDSPRLLEVDAS